MIAFTRAVPESIVSCELTHIAREPIDLAVARAQHEQYEDALREAGAQVVRLPDRDDLADSVFVEDTALVLDELAVIARPGAESRRAEVDAVVQALSAHRRCVSIEAPATLDGGDVLVLERDVVVGLTPRTNLAGVQQLRALLVSSGYSVRGIPVKGCLHLKSAVTRAGERTLVVNPAWVNPSSFPGWEVVPTDPGEPFAANVLWLGSTTIVGEQFPATNRKLAQITGARILPVPAGELAKAEGGVTCCSLIVG